MSHEMLDPIIIINLFACTRKACKYCASRNTIHQLFIYLSLLSKSLSIKKNCVQIVYRCYMECPTPCYSFVHALKIFFSRYIGRFLFFFLPSPLQSFSPFLRVQINPRCNVKALVLLFPRNLSLGLCLKYLIDINIHFLLSLFRTASLEQPGQEVAELQAKLLRIEQLQIELEVCIFCIIIMKSTLL